MSKMFKSKVAWNKDHTRSVVLSKLKEFSIDDVIYEKRFAVKGWFNKENFFDFGSFDSKEEAELFVEEVHKLL